MSSVTVIVSQGQSANPRKRALEEDLVAALLMERGLDVTIIPHLYDLAPDGTGMLCLQGVSGHMIVLSWLYPRAAHWTLARHGIQGQVGQTLLVADEDDDDDEELEEEGADEESSSDEAPSTENDSKPARKIYCLQLGASEEAQPFVEEIRRIVAELAVPTVQLQDWIGGAPKPEQLQRYLDPAGTDGQLNKNGSANHGAAAELPVVGQQPNRIEEQTGRRWYPVIDFSRCTNCLECLDFCLFGVYGTDRADTILVEQPDNCRKGCPACSRVCPENAIIFPQHKTPAIAGSSVGTAGALKIDLSKLFGAPNALDQAVLERDVELVNDGREAVGHTVGMPKRQSGKADGPKDELDGLMDELDSLDL